MRLLWLIPVLPFLGAFLNGVVLRNRLGKKGVWIVACGSILATLMVSIYAIMGYVSSELFANEEAFEQTCGEAMAYYGYPIPWAAGVESFNEAASEL